MLRMRPVDEKVRLVIYIIGQDVEKPGVVSENDGIGFVKFDVFEVVIREDVYGSYLNYGN